MGGIKIAYLYLSIAIIIEVIGTSFLKASTSSGKVSFFFVGVGCFILALVFMTLSFKTIPLSIAYAIWSGVGTAGAAVIGVLIWHEKLSYLNYFGMTFVIVGVVLLNVPTVTD